MSKVNRYTLNFTGPESHVLTLKRGFRSIAVGPDPESDLVVGEEDTLNWQSLIDLDLPPNESILSINYQGRDMSIVQSTTALELDSLGYISEGAVNLDFTETTVRVLTLESRGNQITAKLPSATRISHLILVGNPEDFSFAPAADGSVPRITVKWDQETNSREIFPADGSAGTLWLPEITGLRGVQSLEVSAGLFGLPLDVRSLLSYRNVRQLELLGSLAHLEALAEMDLTSLTLRTAPDLAGLPPLSSWPNLTSLLVHNCDATITSRLRKELKTFPEDHRFSANSGRKRSWYLTELGLPFNDWSDPLAAQATRAFKQAAKRLSDAKDSHQAREALDEFITIANAWPGIDTSEREDILEAVNMLAQLTTHLDQEAAFERFNALREF